MQYYIMAKEKFKLIGEPLTGLQKLFGKNHIVLLLMPALYYFKQKNTFKIQTKA